MVKTIKRRRLEFLEDTVEFYNEDVNRRATEGSIRGMCSYKTPDGRKCAIGRHIPDKLYTENIEGNSIDENIMNLLPIKIRKLSKGFLAAVQSLHDKDINWTKKGISNIGLKDVERIKRIWINNEESSSSMVVLNKI